MTATEFPLIDQELRRLGRRKATFGLRIVPLVIVVALTLFALQLLQLVSFGGPAEVAAGIEAFIFRAGIYVQQALVVLFAPVIAAGAIAREKHDRTITLLMLADFRGFDLYVSKAVSVCAQVGALVLTVVPVVIFNVSLGGLEWQEALLGEMRVIALVLFTAAVGMFCSTIASRPADAVAMSYVAVLVFVLLMTVVLLPMTLSGLGSMQAGWPVLFVVGVLMPSTVAVVLAFFNVRLLAKPPAERAAATRAPNRRAAARGQAGIAAIYRGAVQSLGSVWLNRPRRWIVLAVCTVGFVFAELLSPLPLTWIVMFIVAYEIISTIEASERQDTFDTLAVTPATERAFANALMGVHIARSFVFFPGMAIASAVGMYSAFSMSATVFNEPVSTGAAALGIAITVVADAVFLLFVIVASCYSITRRSTTAWRIAFVAFNYFGLAFLGNVASTMLSVAFMTPGFGTPGQSFYFYMQALSPSGTILLELMLGYVYYISLAKRIGKQWRNGGSNRLILSPAGAQTCHSL